MARGRKRRVRKNKKKKKTPGRKGVERNVLKKGKGARPKKKKKPDEGT